MDDRSIIEGLDGVTALAKALGEPNSTVHSWKRANRIPRWRRPAVAELARTKGVSLPAEFLEPDAANASDDRNSSNTSAPGRAAGGIASADGPQAANVVAADCPAKTAGVPGPAVASDKQGKWAGRVVTCAVCERRLTDTSVRSCQASDCPHSGREAA